MSLEFSTYARDASDNLRRLPAEVRRALSKEVKTQVAEPLAARISAAAHGPWARVLSAGTKARAGANPTIVVGGKSPKLSGGGYPRVVVFGAEFGGGKRFSPVLAHTRRGGRVRGYRRASTNQFHRHHDPFVFSTVGDAMPNILEAYADVVTRVMDEVT